MLASTDMNTRVPRMTVRKKRRTGRVARQSVGSYNGPQTNQFRLADNFDHFRLALRPLAKGHPVALAMDDHRPVHAKARSSVSRKRVVVITPFNAPGLALGSYVISILGKGSCLVWPSKPNQSANLVLAGMPARLANVLLNKLQVLEG